MALQLEQNYKGIQANYWKIIYLKYNAISGITTATLALFFSQETRQEDIANRLEEKEFQFKGNFNIEQSYLKIKESVKALREITPAVTTGSVVTNDFVIVTPAVTEEYETNPFVNALDV
jgi:hypothetical protein